MKLVVGLGNVGKRYAHTRHNIGFMVADELAELLQRQLITEYETGRIGHIAMPSHTPKWVLEAKTKSEIIKFDLAADEIILAKPQTMMNGSGEAVQKLMQKYRVSPNDVWIIFDDVDVEFGRLRFRDGGTSGQQGMKSIIGAIGGNSKRVRMGISLNNRAIEPSEVYVLKPFNEDEQAQLPAVIEAAATAVTARLSGDNFEELTVNLIP